MFQFRHAGPEPTLQEVAQHYGLPVSDLDSAFGVVATDSVDHLYVVLVAPSGFERLRERLEALGLADDPAVGLFANPTVEPF